MSPAEKPKAKRNSGGQFVKGCPKIGGRKKGTPNKATREWREFIASVASNVQLQDALVEAIYKHPQMLFRAAEFAVGRPRPIVEPPGLTLYEYAEAHPARGKCLICTCSRRAELEEAFRAGTSIAVMHRWLREECHIDIGTDSPLRHHFLRSRHHEQK